MMRRAVRLERSIDLLRARSVPRTTPFCSTCERRSAAFSTSATYSEKKPLTERIRSKIWGMESPPGQDDPYADAASYNRIKKQLREEDQQEKKQLSEAEYQKLMQTYEPSIDAEGLESVGGFGGWWRQNWDPEHTFEGFMPRGALLGPARISAALHRSIVEVFTLYDAGLPLTINLNKSIDNRLRQKISRVEFRQTEAGVVLDNAHIKAELLQALAPGQGLPTPEQDVSADYLSETSTKFPLDGKRDPIWLQISLRDPDVKFAVLKRTMQLTGRRISDSAVKSIECVQDVLAHLATPPKPRKVVDALSQNDLPTLPNVTVKSRRITPIDKEVSIGRWKVIEKELQSKGLPIVGKN